MKSVRLDLNSQPPRAAWRRPAVLLAALILPAVGCQAPSSLRTAERFNRGYVIILPGVDGASLVNVSMAQGLNDGGVKHAIEIHDWTTGTALLFAMHLRAIDRNKREASRIAQKIIRYQDQYPGRPVHLIGHSGGGGMAVLTLEALPPNRKVTSAILLAPAIAPDYDLRRALRRTDYGLYNYYSPYDVGFLRLGTTIMGTIDGRHTSAAGVRGFIMPWGLDQEGRQLYGTKLRQQGYTREMARSGHAGNHFGWATRGFNADWLAPLITNQSGNAAHYAVDSADPRSSPTLRTSGDVAP